MLAITETETGIIYTFLYTNISINEQTKLVELCLELFLTPLNNIQLN